MLKNLFVLSLIWLATSLTTRIQAQELSLNQMITMYEGDYDQINSTLLPQGWLFTGTSTEVDSTICGEKTQATWAYRLDSGTEKAKGFVNYLKSENCLSLLTYQTLDIAVYNRIRSTIAKFGMLRVDSASGSVEGENGTQSYVSTEFEGAKYWVSVSIVSHRDDEGDARNFYHISLRQKSSLGE